MVTLGTNVNQVVLLLPPVRQPVTIGIGYTGFNIVDVRNAVTVEVFVGVVTQWIQPVLQFPAVQHAVAVCVWVLGVGAVLHLLDVG